VYSIPELIEDPQFISRGVWGNATHPQHGHLRQVGSVLAGMDRSPSEAALPDPSKTDTDELLRGVGVTAAQLAQLRRDGVVA